MIPHLIFSIEYTANCLSKIAVNTHNANCFTDFSFDFLCVRTTRFQFFECGITNSSMNILWIEYIHYFMKITSMKKSLIVIYVLIACPSAPTIQTVSVKFWLSA